MIFSTEAKILEEIEKLGKANAFKLRRRLGLISVEYTSYLCNILVKAGKLEQVSTGQRPVYRIARFAMEPDYEEMKRKFPGRNPAKEATV